MLNQEGHRIRKKNLTVTIPKETIELFRKQYPKVCISCYLESHILMDLRK